MKETSDGFTKSAGKVERLSWEEECEYISTFNTLYDGWVENETTYYSGKTEHFC